MTKTCRRGLCVRFPMFFQIPNMQSQLDYAAANDFIIVSKDSDFHQLSFLFGAPPKTIWLRCGNCSTKILEIIIRRNAKKILMFVDDRESALLVIDQKH